MICRVIRRLADRYPFYDIILNYPDNKHLLFSAIGLFLSYMYSMSAGVVSEGELGASFILQHKYFKSMLAHIALFFFLLFTEYVLFPDVFFYSSLCYSIVYEWALCYYISILPLHHSRCDFIYDCHV